MAVVLPGSPRNKPVQQTVAEAQPPSANNIKFIGLPLVLVGTKVDTLDRSLSLDASRTPQQAQHATNFVQAYIRQLGLKYAAGIVFTSTLPARPTNCKALIDYIAHRTLGFELPDSSNLFSATALDCYVPAGSDSQELIDLLPVHNAFSNTSADAGTEATLDLPFERVILHELDTTNIEPPIDIPGVDHNIWLKQKKEVLATTVSSNEASSSFHLGLPRTNMSTLGNSPIRSRLSAADFGAASGLRSGSHSLDRSSEPIEKKAELFFASMTKQHRQSKA